MGAHIFSKGAVLARRYPLLFLFILLAFWGVLNVLLPVTYYRDILAPNGEGDRVYFGKNVAVSQEFIPRRGLSGIEIPVGSTSNSDSALTLRIRELSSDKDIVSVPLASRSGDTARFQFGPIWNTPSRLVWTIEAPASKSKEFWVFREQDASVYTEGSAFTNTRRMQGNVAFREIWKMPRIGTVLLNKALFTTFDDFEVASFFVGIASAIVILLLLRIHIHERHIVAMCIALGIIFHAWFAMNTPLIIDEASYIQDVLQASPELLPFRDFLTKGPMYLALLWVWSAIVPHTVLGWRLFSALFWAFGGLAFWQLTKEVGLRERSRIIAVASWNIMPAAVALTTPLLLQTTSIAVSVIGMLLGFVAMRRSSWKIASYSAIVLACAFFIRITSAIPALITLLFFLAHAKKGFKMRLAAVYVGTGLLMFAVVFGVSVAFLGLPKAAVLVNMEAFLISQTRQDQIQTSAIEPEPFIRSATIESRLLWNTGVLLVTAIFVVPLIFVSKQRIVFSVIVLVAVLFVAWNVSIHLRDTGFLLPKKFVSTRWLIDALLFGIPLVSALAALVYNTRAYAREYVKNISFLCIVALWLFITTYAYAHWGRFRQSYFIEFLPQLALLLGIGLDFTFGIWSKIQPRWFSYAVRSAFLVLICMSVYQGYVLAYRYPHTGTVDQASLVNISRLIQYNVPQGAMIFTAQPIATAFAHRDILFGYSHPGWYREARLGNISEKLRNLLFKTPEEITAFLSAEATYVLLDSRTDEIYFDGYPERRELLKNKFEIVGSTENAERGETYALYRRL